MAQSFTDFRALPVGNFVSYDFVNASGTGVMEDNSYPEGNALVCGGATWAAVAQVGLLHQAEVEVSVVCAWYGSTQVAIRTPGPVAGFTAGGNVAAILIEAGSSEKPLGRVGGQ